MRILVKVHKKDNNPRLAEFSECILSYFESTDGTANLFIELRDNFLTISDFSLIERDKVVIKHHALCPMLHLNPDTVSLPDEISTRGVDVGVAVIVESSDGKILLTRRSRNLRIFPGVWVPPGGHIEENETLMEAGLRELKEETGLDLKPSDFIQQKMNLVALWESVYPTVGAPVRHHIVVYFHAKLLEKLTAHVMESQINFDPVEVDACAWLSKDIITAIAHSFDGDYNKNIAKDILPKSFRATVLDDSNKQTFCDRPTETLVRVSAGDKHDQERVSTGTKFALQKMLEFQSSSL